MEERLKERRKQAEAQFEVLQEQKKECVSKISVIDTEIVKLQGEYRLLNDLLASQAKNVATDANKLEIEEK
jgi:hypothetical protein